MCGRYLITSTPEAMRALFRYLETPNFPPRYNVAPSQPIPIVRLRGGQRQLALVRWGLMPSWVKDPREFSLLINARGDSVVDKPAFRAAMRRRRCLVPADGFFEWKHEGNRRRPFVVRPKSGGPVAFAGLWETWTGPNGEEMESAAIITTDANRALRAIHDRVPVAIMPDAFDLWLDCERVDARTAAALLVPPPEEFFEAYEISTAVNRVANDSPDLIAPLSGAPLPAEPAQAAKDKDSAPRRAKPKANRSQGSLF